MMIFNKISKYVYIFFCRPETVPEISLEELEEPLLSTSSANDSAIAVESEVRKMIFFLKIVQVTNFKKHKS